MLYLNLLIIYLVIPAIFKFVEVQPNDGFGVLLPRESLTLDIIFKANRAKEYNFGLTCRSEFNRYGKKLLV